MRILICTPLYPPDIGGPAKYAQNIAVELKTQDHEVKILVYKLEKKLPTGIRHFLYFFRIFFNIIDKDFVLALDTFSVGLPSVCAAKIFRKKIIIRVGGDFLWENYVEKTGNLITLSDFNQKPPLLSFKHKIIFKLTKFVLQNSTAVVFSTDWLKNIFKKAYALEIKKLFTIENFYGAKLKDNKPLQKNFLWAGRQIKLKNIEILKRAFYEAQKYNKNIQLELSKQASHEELMEKIKNCYAVILPSISEASPNFILEAIRFNKPFILTKETGFYAQLKSVGLFVDPLDKTDIKNKILFLAYDSNYGVYKEKVANFSFLHSWREISDAFLNIYQTKNNEF